MEILFSVQSNPQNVMNQNQAGPNQMLPQANQGQPAQNPSQGHPAQRERIWSGCLEWMEKSKAGESKVVSQLPCLVMSTVKDGEPEV